MSMTVRRIGLGLLVLVVAVLASLATRMSFGSAVAGTPSPTYEVQTNVTVHLKGGVTHTYANVSKVRLYDGARKFSVTVRGGKTHVFGKRFRSYGETFVQDSLIPAGFPTSVPTGIPTGVPSGIPTSVPTGLPSLPISTP
jgi:hypothetical protein